MRVSVGSDERTTLTDRIVRELREKDHRVTLRGPLDDGAEEWAAVGIQVGEDIAASRADVGVLFCWTGTGVCIAANKVPGVRAALCADAETARLARRYNHANVLVMSLRATSEALGVEILQAFLETPDGADDFDRRNVAQLGRRDGSVGEPATT